MGLDDAIKQRLNIKYNSAKKLLDDAREELGPGASEEELIEVACELFEDLDETEQEAMRTSVTQEEPEWKRKAKEQAEKRELAWEKEQEEQRLRGEAEARGESTEPEVCATTTTTTTRTISKKSRVVKVKPEGPATQVGATVSCCVVM